MTPAERALVVAILACIVTCVALLVHGCEACA